MQPIARRLLLALFCLLPLITLFHKNDLGRWDTARSAMAAPDEFSYLLLADNLLHHHTTSLHATIGRDTFYPPGYPALLALFSAPSGDVTAFRAHLLNALLLSACVLLSYLLAKELLTTLAAGQHRRFHRSPGAVAWLALLCAALFALNWHVLEGALFVFSEPAFTLVTLAWLTLALRWRDWPASPRKTLPIAALAMLAYAIRGAGLVCVAATLLYPCFALVAAIRAILLARILPYRRSSNNPLLFAIRLILFLVFVEQLRPFRRLASLLLILALAGSTKYLTRYTDNAPNSYPQQLVNGLTHGDQLSFHHPRDYPALALRATELAASHLDDFAQSFTPIPRVEPDLAPLSFIGKTFALLALAAWLSTLLGLLPSYYAAPSTQHSALLFPNLYLAFYLALYLLWPFNMPRFWTPILPLMLPYALHAALTLSTARRRFTRLAPTLALLLLLLLNAQELFRQLAPYQRRLNYVSDALAAAADQVLRRSPDPRATFLCVEGGDEYFIFSWYLAHSPARAPGAPALLPRCPNDHERIESLISRTAAAAARIPGARLFIASYFDESLFQEVFANLRREQPARMARYTLVKIYQKGIEATLWEMRPLPTPDSAPFPRPPLIPRKNLPAPH